MNYDINYKSPFYRYANQTLEWLSNDTKELYIDNIKKNINLLKSNGWITRKFTYKFNSHGFRCEEFEEDQENIVFLGCSNTMGTGLPIECVWPTLIAKQLGLACYNLGIAGGSNDTAFRLGYHYIPKLKPKLIVLLSPRAARFEFFCKDREFVQFGPWGIVEWRKHYLSKYYKEWSLHEENQSINKIKNISALTHVCKKNNVKFLILNTNELNSIDLARDLNHSGVKSHQKFSEHVLNKIELLT